MATQQTLPGMEQVGFGIDGDAGDIKNVIGVVEKAMVSMNKALSDGADALTKAMKSLNEQVDDNVDKQDDMQNQTGKTTTKFDEITDALSDNFLGLDKVGISWASLIGALSAFSLGAVAVGIVSFFVSATNKALEFLRTITKLNQVYDLSTKGGREIVSTIMSVGAAYGYTRDELTELTRETLAFGRTPELLKAAGTSWKQYTRETVKFAAATEMSLTEVESMNDELIRVARIPITKLRDVRNAFKYIADQSSMTVSELSSITGSLGNLFTLIEMRTGDSREELTKRFAAFSAVLKDANVDPQKFLGSIEEMLKGSDAGLEQLGILIKFTGRSHDELLDIMSKSPGKLADIIGEVSKNMGDNLKLLRDESMRPLGLEISELGNLAKHSNDKSKKSFNELTTAMQNQIAADEQAQHAATNRMLGFDSALNTLKNAWDNAMITVGTAMLNQVITPLVTLLVPVIRDQLIPFLTQTDWKSGFAGLLEVIKGVYTFMTYAVKPAVFLYNIISKVLEIRQKLQNFVFDSIGDLFAKIMEQGKALFGWLGNLPGIGKLFETRSNYVKGVDKTEYVQPRQEDAVEKKQRLEAAKRDYKEKFSIPDLDLIPLTDTPDSPATIQAKKIYNQSMEAARVSFPAKMSVTNEQDSQNLAKIATGIDTLIKHLAKGNSSSELNSIAFSMGQ